jgi:hypothetical protein
MPNSQNVTSPEQIAANRANAAMSSGPRSPEGKARSAQNARKHGFAAAAYTVVGLEDVQEVANLKDDAVDFYQPVNSQELFAVERIALTQQALLRAARLEAGLFTACLNEVPDLPDKPIMTLDPEMIAADLGQEQRLNLLLAEGFERSAARSNALSLCARYSAHVERQHRRAVAEFDRLKALRPEIPNKPSTAAGLAGAVRAPKHAAPNEPNPPAAVPGETNPIPSKPPTDWLAVLNSLPTGSNFQPRHLAPKPAGPSAASDPPSTPAAEPHLVRRPE